jgi:hypothetical protein
MDICISKYKQFESIEENGEIGSLVFFMILRKVEVYKCNKLSLEGIKWSFLVKK